MEKSFIIVLFFTLLSLSNSATRVKVDDLFNGLYSGDVYSGYLKTTISGDELFYISYDTLVSMNMFVFYPNFFKLLENDFIDFINNTKNLVKDEFLIPIIMYEHIKKGDKTCEVIDNHAIWKGITYKEDLIELKEYINELIERGVYPVDLYK